MKYPYVTRQLLPKHPLAFLTKYEQAKLPTLNQIFHKRQAVQILLRVTDYQQVDLISSL